MGTLEFEKEEALPASAEVSLKAKNETEPMQTLFKGSLHAHGYAVNAPQLFNPLPVRNWATFRFMP